MKPKLIYYHDGAEELHNPTDREVVTLSRRSFIRRSTLFLPLAYVAGAALAPWRAKASSVIVNRTISAASQNAISMTNATWARPVTMPASWTKIRLGVTMHFTNTGGNLSSNPIFTMGFNSGTAQQYGSATCKNFVGCAFDRSTWTFNAGSTTWYSIPMPIGRVRVGTTNTDSAALAAGANSIFNSGAAAASADRACYMLDLYKGSPNFTFHVPFYLDNSLGGPAGDFTATTFLATMPLISPANPGGAYTQGSITDRTLAVDEAGNGTLNSINVYWNRADLSPEICNVAVAVLA
jgi:hypothetical protein